MGRFVVALTMAAALGVTQQPDGAKRLFYDPAGVGVQSPDVKGATRPRAIPPPPFRRHPDGTLVHGGIHYWLQTADAAPISETAARVRSGKYSIHIRTNVGSGFLTVWDVSGPGKELSLREDSRWSGFRPGHDEYVVPGTFEFSPNESAAHVIIVWAWSQSEVGRDPASARRRVGEMSAWHRKGVPSIIRESDDATPGEIGTYVVNRAGGGVVAEILFRP
jgi:hypothetical protein